MQTCPRSAGRRTARAALREGEAGDGTTDDPRLLSDLAGDGGSGRLFTRDMAPCGPGRTLSTEKEAIGWAYGRGFRWNV